MEYFFFNVYLYYRWTQFLQLFFLSFFYFQMYNYNGKPHSEYGKSGVWSKFGLLYWSRDPYQTKKKTSINFQSHNFFSGFLRRKKKQHRARVSLYTMEKWLLFLFNFRCCCFACSCYDNDNVHIVNLCTKMDIHRMWPLAERELHLNIVRNQAVFVHTTIYYFWWKNFS